MKKLSVTKDDRKDRRAAAGWAAIAACAAVLLAQHCFAQSTVAKYAFQKVQMPTAAEVKLAWKTPPSEYGPEPYFGMNGAVTIQSLAHDLDTMKSLGFHAVTAQAGGGMTTTYLTPEYFAFFKQFALEAKKRDMKVWIVDDIGYPSGFAGGYFTKEKPELRMQALSIGQRLPVKGGETLNQAVGPDAVAAVAVNATGDRVSVPISGGNIAWTAPAGGDWTVMVVEHVFRTSPTRSDANPTHAKDSSNSLEDYMNPEATAAYLEHTHQGYYNAMPELFGTTILGFRGDEPDYSISGLPWTPKFFDTFQQVKGYDIRPYLGALLLSAGGGGGPRPRPAAAAPGGQTTPAAAQAPRTPPPPAVKLTDAEVRAKGDYYDVFSQMFRDGFFKPQGLWCAAHGVEYQVHLNHEEMEMDLVRSEGDFERDMKYVEEPGIDSIWHQIWTDTVSDFPRLASSAAHVYGHPRAFTETFAAYRPEPDATMARYILNEEVVRGVNVIETMFYPATSPADAFGPPASAATAPTAPTAAAAAAPTSAPAGAGAPPARPRGGPSALMRDPAWPALMQYLQRLTYVMSMGRPAAQVALYIPSSSMWLGDAASDTAFVSSERMLAERQIDFDIININALAEDLKAGPEYLESMSGNRYRTVIVPSAAVLMQTELDRLKALAKGGGKVLFLGRTPTLISGKTIKDARAATPEDFAWATVETSAQLPPTPTPPAAAPATPPGPQVVPAEIETALDAVVGTKDVALDAPDAALKVMTRRLKDANVYLFFNEGAQGSSHSVTLKTAGKTVEAWDPATGTVSPVAATAAKGAVTVKLDLKPYETELLTVR
ncbi:MAG: glycosyl hydrolase [Acidobacteriaceae bacterium]|jgi:hypothetical protein